MSLSISQYDAIMREYEQRQNDSRAITAEHRSEVYDLIPEYEQIADKITELAGECAMKVLSGEEGKEAIAKLRTDIELLTAKQESLLSDFGFPKDYLEPVYVCPDCQDTGYIDGVKCHCLRQRILRELYRQSNIETVLEDENFDKLSFDYYTDTEAEEMRKIVDTCRDFADGFDDGYENILLLGNVGVGKTYLSNCMAKAILDSGHSVIYFTAFQLFDVLAQYAFRSKDTSEYVTDVHDDIFDCDLLIIDDLGTENVNSFVISQLFLVLNERDMRKKSTIISTNLSLSMLAERYSERNVSRLFGKYKMIKPDIADMRIRIKRQQAQEQ